MIKNKLLLGIWERQFCNNKKGLLTWRNCGRNKNWGGSKGYFETWVLPRVAPALLTVGTQRVSVPVGRYNAIRGKVQILGRSVCFFILLRSTEWNAVTYPQCYPQPSYSSGCNEGKYLPTVQQHRASVGKLCVRINRYLPSFYRPRLPKLSHI